jgi:hypothetical protein
MLCKHCADQGPTTANKKAKQKGVHGIFRVWAKTADFEVGIAIALQERASTIQATTGL